MSDKQRMNISDEAVEAAYWANPEEAYADNLSKDHIRVMLEAAAPYLMAQAWQEGRQARHDHMIGKSPSNPYRSAGAGE